MKTREVKCRLAMLDGIKTYIYHTQKGISRNKFGEDWQRRTKIIDKLLGFCEFLDSEISQTQKLLSETKTVNRLTNGM